MKKTILMASLLFLQISVTQAQLYFQKSIGSDSTELFRSIISTQDGGFAAVGITYSFDVEGDVLLCKFNGGGDLLWSKSYGSNLSEEGYDVAEDSSGHLILLAQVTFDLINGDDDIMLIKTQSDGTFIWNRDYAVVDGSTTSYSEQGYALNIASDGNYVVAGATNSFFIPYYPYVFKTDTSGTTMLWSSAWNIPGSTSFFLGADTTFDGGIVACGERILGSNDFIVAKYNSNGIAEWKNSIGTSKVDFGFDIRQTSDGGFVAVGLSSSIDSLSANFMVIRLNSDGSIRWAKDIGAAFNNRANTVFQDQDGSFVIGGYTVTDTTGFSANGTSIHNACLMKLDSSGTQVIWCNSYGESTVESRAYSVNENPAGGYSLVGLTFSFGATTGDAYLLHVSENGESGCFQTALSTQITDVTVSSVPIGTDETGGIDYTFPYTMQPVTLTENIICTTTSTNNLNPPPFISLYPNPASDVLTIDLNNFEIGDAFIHVIDPVGRTVVAAKIKDGTSSSFKLDVSKLTPGIYTVQIKDNHLQLAKRFVKIN